MQHLPSVTQVHANWTWLVIVCVGVLLALTAWGSVLLNLWPRLRLNRAPIPHFCESLLHGFLIFSLAGFGGLLAGVPVATTFLCGSVMTGLLGAVSFRRRQTAGALRHPAPPPHERSLSLAAIFLIVSGSLLWSITSLRGMESSGDDFVLVPWQDFFFHARLIGSFALFGGDSGTLHPAAHGVPLAPYHYGSYLVPALVARLTGAPAIQVATSVYPVLGMLLTGAAMLVLTHAAAGAGASVLAVFILFFLPDPSCWVPGSTRWTSYFFFQQVGVGGAYGVAVLGMSLAYAMQGLRNRSLLPCALSLCLFLAAGLFKVQIVLAYGVFFFVFVIWNAPLPSRWMRLAGILAVLAAAGLAATALGSIPNAPTMGLSANGVATYVKSNLLGGRDVATPVLFALAPVAALVLFLATFGFLFPISIYLGWFLRKEAAWKTVLQLLLMCLIAQACVRLLIADNQGFGDGAEINRKTLVWPYFMMVHCAAVLLWAYFQKRPVALPRKWLTATLACSLLALTIVSSTRVQVWAKLSEQATRIHVPGGLFAAADHLRQHALPTDVVQLCKNDEFNQLAALSERPVYIAKLMINSTPETAIERERFAAVAQIMQQADFRSAAPLMRKLRISWFLMSPGCTARWEAQLLPVLATGGYRLYKVAGS